MITIIFTILLLEGFITISVEILTIRQLMPFYGSSVIITSIIIGIFLLFLALGYWRGGTYKTDFFKQLHRNFSFSLIWIGVGLSYTLISLFFYSTVYFLQWPFILSLLTFLLLILSPIVYWLGQTVPLATNLFSKELRISHISGRALFLSTIGSFLGAMLTALVLFHYLGVAWTVVINCSLLFLLIVNVQSYTHYSFFSLVLLLVALLFIYYLNVQVEKGYFKKTNNYGNYQIIEQTDFSKILRINESNSSMITPNNTSFPYLEFIRAILFKDLNLQNKKILVIGAGGFTFSAAGTNNNHITYVDIDPDIKDVAEKHLLKKNINGTFIGADARTYLLEDNKKYDVIISDVYTNNNVIPPALVTREYFKLLSNRIEQNGFAIFNIIANPFFKDVYSQTLYNTIHSVFPYCAVIPLQWKPKLSNVIYICPKNANNNGMYTDDLNRSTFDLFTLSESDRQ